MIWNKKCEKQKSDQKPLRGLFEFKQQFPKCFFHFKGKKKNWLQGGFYRHALRNKTGKTIK